MRNIIAGTPETIAAKVQGLVDAGINHLLVRFLGEWTGETRAVSENSMRLFAREVMPRFRDIPPPTDPLALDRFKRAELKGAGKALDEAVAPANKAYNETVAASLAELQRMADESVADLLSFFADRLKVQLREQGARHDLVDAVFALGGQDDLLMVVRRVEALGKFLDTDDGKNLLAGTKRAANILRIEEKKDGKAYDGAPEPALYSLDEEKTLAKAIDEVRAEAGAAVAKEDFAVAMSAMAKLRPAVDAFFEHVKVNDDDAKVRENRLKLLNEIRAATRAVADFSKIEG